MSKATTITVAIYALGAVLTFGCAFNRLHDRYAAEPDRPWISPTERAVMGATPAAALWPFYLSAAAFERSHNSQGEP